MAQVTLEHLHQDILVIKEELNRLSSFIDEDYELTEDAKRELAEARQEPDTEHVDQEEVEKILTSNITI